MKLCICFHCLCDNYDAVPDQGEELFVSLEDMADFAEQFAGRGYSFTSLEDPSPNTLSFTFDDGYRNNLLFSQVAQRFNIPYLVFVSTHYVQSGDPFPWLADGSANYSQMHLFDYYADYAELRANHGAAAPGDLTRPMTFDELNQLNEDPLAEIGCHGHYHQPLSQKFEGYLQRERDQCMSTLEESLGKKPRYFSLANGMYTKSVVKELLKTFDRVLTIEGRPFRFKDKVIHRISLVNPRMGGSLVSQVDHHLMQIRQVRRAIRTRWRMMR